MSDLKMPRLLTPKESAPIVRTTTPQFYNWIADETIPPYLVVRLGRKILIDEDKLRQWLQSGGTANKCQDQLS